MKKMLFCVLMAFLFIAVLSPPVVNADANCTSCTSQVLVTEATTVPVILPAAAQTQVAVSILPNNTANISMESNFQTLPPETKQAAATLVQVDENQVLTTGGHVIKPTTKDAAWYTDTVQINGNFTS